VQVRWASVCELCERGTEATRDGVRVGASIRGMARPRRRYPAEYPIHVIGRGVHGDRLCPNRPFGTLLYNGIGTWCRECEIEIIALCVMGTHYHLLALGAPAAFSLALHRAHSRHANIRNHIEDRRGRVFGRRYRVVSIRDEVHFTQAISYVALNPVHHRLCEHPRLWRNSTYAALAGDRRSPAWFDRERALRRCGFSDGDAYRRAMARSRTLPAPPTSAGALTRHRVTLLAGQGASRSAIADMLGIGERQVYRILAAARASEDEATQESNLPTDGLRRPARFEDAIRHQTVAAPPRG